MAKAIKFRSLIQPVENKPKKIKKSNAYEVTWTIKKIKLNPKRRKNHE